MFSKCKNTKEQGNIGLTEAISYFTRNCYTVSLPINDSQDYDLIADIDNVLYKVQVKTTASQTSNGSYRVELRNKGGTKGEVYREVSSSNCTLLFILCSNKDMYLIPEEYYETRKTSLSLGEGYFKFFIL